MNRIAQLIGLLAVASLSCTLFAPTPTDSAQEIQITEFPDPEISVEEPVDEGQEQPEEPPQESEPSTEAVCEVDNWRIIPVGVYEFQQGDGWKTVVVDIAVENGTPYWASIDIDPAYGRATITTEGGFIYEATGGYWTIPEQPESPYSGWYVYPTLGVDTPFLPPGFRATGTFHRGPWLMTFEVAESQVQLMLNLDVVHAACILPNGEIERDKPTVPVVLDLGRDVQSVSFPTDTPESEFSTLLEPVEIPGYATISFSNPRRVEEDSRGTNMEIDFTVENASQGYSIEGGIGQFLFLIGDDGFVYAPSGPHGHYSAGPGQTESSTLGFGGADVGSLKLVWVDLGATGGPFVIQRALNLPEIQSAVVQQPTETAQDTSDQPFLGVTFQTITPNLAEEHELSAEQGALITEVVPGSPADQVDLREGDIVVAVDGKTVDDDHGLAQRILQYHPGDEIELKILRGQRELTVAVILGWP